MPVNSGDLEAAAKGNPALRRILAEHADAFDGVERKLGIKLRSTKLLVAPPGATLDVVGVDGHFQVTITNPTPGVSQVAGHVPLQFEGGVGGTEFAQRKGDPFHAQDARNKRKQPIVRARDNRSLGLYTHELQSATSSNFDASSSVTTYGPSEKTHYDITDPNVTKVWRVRTRLRDSEFSDWVYFTSPATCGVVGVYSGVLRIQSGALGNAATTPNGSSPLTQSGTTTTILVAASAWKTGDQTISYSSGSVNPGSFGTWYVYADDPKHAGGTVTFVATATQAVVTSSDGRIYFGKITTAGGGGGTGSGGGNGGCTVAGTMLTTLSGGTLSMIDVAELRVGDTLLGVDSGEETVERIELRAAQPCLRLVFASGATLDCSSVHPLMLDGGGCMLSFDLQIGARVRSLAGTDTLIAKQYIGDFTIYRLELSHTKTYYANGILSHNVLSK